VIGINGSARRTRNRAQSLWRTYQCWEADIVPGLVEQPVDVSVDYSVDVLIRRVRICMHGGEEWDALLHKRHVSALLCA